MIGAELLGPSKIFEAPPRKKYRDPKCTGATFSKGDVIGYTSMQTASLFHLNCICIFQSTREQRSRVLLGLLLQYYRLFYVQLVVAIIDRRISINRQVGSDIF